MWASGARQTRGGRRAVAHGAVSKKLLWQKAGAGCAAGEMSGAAARGRRNARGGGRRNVRGGGMERSRQGVRQEQCPAVAAGRAAGETPGVAAAGSRSGPWLPQLIRWRFQPQQATLHQPERLLRLQTRHACDPSQCLSLCFHCRRVTPACAAPSPCLSLPLFSLPFLVLFTAYLHVFTAYHALPRCASGS